MRNPPERRPEHGDTLTKGSEAGELDPSRADPAAHAAVRWFAALIAVVYGFAKLNGSQFTILDSELDRPMGEVSGFWCVFRLKWPPDSDRSGQVIPIDVATRFRGKWPPLMG